MLAFSVTLMFRGEPNLEDNSEPLDAVRKAQFQRTHLEFIAETGRIIVTEHGTREIIWDPPELSTLEESIRMGVEAEETGDTDLHPLCTPEYSEYLKARTESRRARKDPYFPACYGIPDVAGFGPNRRYARSETDPDHMGYDDNRTTVSE